jgi:hypothetical protein
MGRIPKLVKEKALAEHRHLSTNMSTLLVTSSRSCHSASFEQRTQSLSSCTRHIQQNMSNEHRTEMCCPMIECMLQLLPKIVSLSNNIELVVNESLLFEFLSKKMFVLFQTYTIRTQEMIERMNTMLACKV